MCFPYKMCDGIQIGGKLLHGQSTDIVFNVYTFIQTGHKTVTIPLSKARKRTNLQWPLVLLHA